MTKQDAINKASHIAYEEDTDQVVGKDQSGEWVIMSWEDPKSDCLIDAVIVDSTGEK